jgi:hypothetical protein
MVIVAVVIAVVAYLLPGTPARWVYVRAGHHMVRLEVQDTHAIDLVKWALYLCAIVLTALAAIRHDDRITTAEMLRDGAETPDMLHRSSYSLTNLLRF